MRGIILSVAQAISLPVKRRFTTTNKKDFISIRRLFQPNLNTPLILTNK